MREASTSPPQLSHLNVLIEAIAQSPETLDRAFFTLQDIVQKEGKAIDITAFNALLSACLILNDASRAISSYRDAASFNVVPNLETYNILLHAASKVGHRELAMYILSDLKKAQITPNQDTYARVILTCLFEPEGSYDQAFIYLEEMKASGWIPSSGLYASFVKKCVYHNDDRVVTVLEEMKKMGYSTKSLETYVMDAARLGIRSKLMDRKTTLTQPDHIEDEAVQRYLEWKGERD
jgi:pentatricopeptide repeat protein